MKVVLLNGPNLNRLGKRQPEVYGQETLAEIEQSVRVKAERLGIEFEAHQSNSEAELIGWIHAAADEGAAVIINPGAFTHTSIAIRDALQEIADGAGFIEVHMSNVYAREEFRSKSYMSDIASGVIVGMGSFGYLAAIDYFAHKAS